VTQGEERSRWKVHADRIVDQNPHLRLSIAAAGGPRLRWPRCQQRAL